MALRAFRDNPSLGGFGGESTGISTSLLLPRTKKAGRQVASNNTIKKKVGEKNRDNVPQSFVATAVDDSFAQIVKELVDNAVDGCHTAANKEPQEETPKEETKKQTNEGESKAKRTAKTTSTASCSSCLPAYSTIARK